MAVNLHPFVHVGPTSASTLVIVLSQWPPTPVGAERADLITQQPRHRSKPSS